MLDSLNQRLKESRGGKKGFGVGGGRGERGGLLKESHGKTKREEKEEEWKWEEKEKEKPVEQKIV